MEKGYGKHVNLDPVQSADCHGFQEKSDGTVKRRLISEAVKFGCLRRDGPLLRHNNNQYASKRMIMSL